jgi:mediator of RNA polymerase II transcription subunit 12
MIIVSKPDHKQSAFIFCPDNFVWPDIWISNKVLLEEIILANFPRSTDDISSLKHNSQTDQLREILKGDFYAVNWRVNELIGDVGVGTGIVGNIFRRRVQLVEVSHKYLSIFHTSAQLAFAMTHVKRKILDSYTDYNDCSKLYYKYFLNPSVAGHIPVSFKDKLEVLLSWATTPLRTSDKRVHLVANTLSHVKHDYKKNGDEFQNILVGWLEQIESIEGGDLLVRLFSELSRRNIFSYGAYVQRMVAKGETECDIVAGKVNTLILIHLPADLHFERWIFEIVLNLRQVACRLC